MADIEINVVDKTTGAFIDLDQRKSDLKKYVIDLPQETQSSMLTKANALRKWVGALEGVIKDIIKESDLEFDDDGVAMWDKHRVKTVNTYRFDKKYFEENGTENEKGILKKAEEIQGKYKKPSSYLKIN